MIQRVPRPRVSSGSSSCRSSVTSSPSLSRISPPLPDRWGWLAFTGALYLALSGVALTGVYHPFTVGIDRSWLAVASVGVAQIAVGASWRTRWSYVLPLVVAVGAAIALSVGATTFTLFVFGGATGAAVVLVALGRLFGAGLRRVGRTAQVAMPLVLFAIAALPLAEAAKESRHLATGRRVPAAIAAMLPLVEDRLNGMCGTGRYRPPAAERARLESQGRALASLTRQHPGWVVRTTYYSEDPPGEHHELMTVRQLAQNQLGNLREFPNCNRPLQQSLAAAVR